MYVHMHGHTHSEWNLKWENPDQEAEVRLGVTQDDIYSITW
jgi:hypothetical protein